MKPLICFLLFIFPPCVFSQSLDVDVLGNRVILINAETKQILFEKNGDVLCFPASTTKIATTLFACHLAGDQVMEKIITARKEALASITPQAKIQSNYRCPAFWLETDGDHIGLKPGECMPMKDLLHAALLASANDACNVLAQEFGGGSIPNFVEGMNQYVRDLGCRNTNFLNPSGLHHPKHQTTPYDLALLAGQLLKQPILREIVKKERYKCPETNYEFTRYFSQSNKLLRSGSYFYPYAIGVKTGTTKAAGRNVVAAAEKDGRTLIGVFLNYKTREALYGDAHTVFEKAFGEPLVEYPLVSAGLTKWKHSIKGAKCPLSGFLANPVVYQTFPSELSDVSLRVEWTPPELPILKGERVGTVKIIHPSGIVLKTHPIYASEGVPFSLLHRFYLLITNEWVIKIGLVICVFFLSQFVYALILRRRKLIKPSRTSLH